ncbi:MAG: 30S ribosomal protein S4 [Candidatus Izemoplasmatales bacterium]|jgi:small subunit ribosomal protein S4|nr:30S ribosomal protein S4 [Candidatus Izemoplasmatales bacterium]MDD4988539.1 30S ribosomal protein S4 [Candidatus Izemoplasmatales bacterium]MDY0373692.1 30S ribosomal protein S4 [Candidatus Izemoplasmatales bacterium]
MSRFTGSQWKVSRRLNYSISETGKETARRPYAPGQHGQKRSKMSEYGTQLQEKQRVRFTYGVNERQFRKTFNEAKKLPGKQGANFLFLLESRLDNLVYRSGFAKTRQQARQLVNHGHIILDGRKASIPSIRVKPGQVISVKEKSRDLTIIKDALTAVVSRMEYIGFDDNKMEATYIRLPERSEILPEIKENLIVELYNK